MKKLIEKHKGSGLKLTPQRLAILDFLDGNTNHPSAEDIFTAVKERYPTISFATVYNTLDILKKRRELVELTIDPARKHYDPDTTLHHHVVCSECGKIGDVFEKDVKLELPKGTIGDFRISSWHIDFSGVCKECEGRLSLLSKQ